jgi:6-phosphogluconate dehydrogenase (decarboxylating)
MKPQIAIFGLGRMGGQIARRLHKNNFTIFAWNRSEKPVKEIKQFGIAASQNIDDVVKHFTAKQRIFWIMLPHAIVDDFLFGKVGLAMHLRKGDIVIDGGNTFYKDTIEHSKKLAKKGVTFFDWELLVVCGAREMVLHLWLVDRNRHGKRLNRLSKRFLPETITHGLERLGQDILLRWFTTESNTA